MQQRRSCAVRTLWVAAGPLRSSRASDVTPRRPRRWGRARAEGRGLLARTARHALPDRADRRASRLRSRPVGRSIVQPAAETHEIGLGQSRSTVSWFRVESGTQGMHTPGQGCRQAWPWTLGLTRPGTRRCSLPLPPRAPPVDACTWCGAGMLSSSCHLNCLLCTLLKCSAPLAECQEETQDATYTHTYTYARTYCMYYCTLLSFRLGSSRCHPETVDWPRVCRCPTRRLQNWPRVWVRERRLAASDFLSDAS